ncbi:MAG: helix-turn-helix domain-containing protein [Firmicutes bacterium]|nr:helix-turn-helix domain-containing protein [Bacillota bacterium]
MVLSIGRNIRRLRGEAGLSQEELAQALHISPQSVSKWERGEGYPDITALPGLARYFGVTLDELMGMDELDDWGFFSHVNNLEKAGQYEEAIRLLREGGKRFPNNHAMRLGLAEALTLAGGDAKEAIALLKQVLAGDANEKRRSCARAMLCLLYAKDGQREKALSLARTLPHIWESREILLTQFLPEDERAAHTRGAILTALHLLCRKIEGAGEWEKVLVLGGEPDGRDANEMLETIGAYLM